MLYKNYLFWLILFLFIFIMLKTKGIQFTDLYDKLSNFSLNSSKNDKLENLDDIIRILIRQASRWTTAARQDTNMLITVLHANYGAGYLWALKDIANSEQIKKATGVDILKFEAEVVKTQDEVTRRLSKLCKGFAPKKSYLTQFGGE